MKYSASRDEPTRSKHTDRPPQGVKSVVVRRAHGGDGGDEDVGEYGGRRRVRGMRRAGDPVGSRKTEE